LSRAIYSQLLTRVYSSKDGTPVMLLVAQSATQTGILQIHRPEFCYTAGGYQLSASNPHAVPLQGKQLPALSIAATRDARTEQIVYWTRIGDHLPVSWTQQRLAVAADNLRGIIPDAVMVRASTYGQDEKAALAVIDSFLSSLIAALPPQTRRVLVG
jgi:EpsI family protein